MRSIAPHLLLLLLSSLGCSDPATPPAVEDEPLLAPPAEGEGVQLSFEATAQPGEELWLCDVGTFDVGGTRYVNEVESRQTPGVHHMDVMALTFTGVELAPGRYDCDELYRTYPALMEKGVFLYASQQPEQKIDLPDGVAAAIPGGLAIMTEMHFVNTRSEPVEIESRVNAYFTDESNVSEYIWGGAVRDTHLNVPAGAEHSEWTRCVLNKDADILFLSSHTHELGRKVRISRFDGQDVGETIYENTDWATPYLQDYTDAPLALKAGEGFEFECHFDNPRAEEVHWGFGAQDEMCQIALVHTPGDAEIACEVVASSDGVLQ